MYHCINPINFRDMAPHRQGKVALDNVSAFNVSVTEYKLKQCEKQLADIDKILGVLSKITDFSSLTANSGPDTSLLYVNCHYLLSTLDAKSSLMWSLVSFLTNVCTSER